MKKHTQARKGGGGPVWNALMNNVTKFCKAK